MELRSATPCQQSAQS